MHKFLNVAAVCGVIAIAGYGYFNYEYQQQQNIAEATTVNGKAVSKAPDFTAYKDLSKRKHAFFTYLMPGIALENQRINKERAKLLHIQKDFNENSLTNTDKKNAARLARLYQVELENNQVTDEWFEQMLHRVDVLPEALVLTQAANESAWGTSRFARAAKNYFGQWCYTEGCGVVPLQRSEGMTHEVAKFTSVQESINRYFMNVNRNDAYAELREIRFQLREDGADLLSLDSAMELSNGLLKYSERGQEYVQDLQSMMRHNEKYWVN